MRTKTLILVIFTIIYMIGITYARGTSFTKGVDIASFDDPTLYSIPKDPNGKDPLSDVAEEIRKKIDPKSDPNWAKDKDPDYVEHINKIYSRYDEFWKLIPKGLEPFYEARICKR